MRVVEESPDRIVVEWRPWGDSLLALVVFLAALAVLFWRPSLAALIATVGAGTLLVLTARYTRLSLDRAAQNLRVDRRSLVGERHFAIGLAALARIDVAPRIGPALPMQWLSLTLTSGDRRRLPGAPAMLPNGALPGIAALLNARLGRH